MTPTVTQPETSTTLPTTLPQKLTRYMLLEGQHIEPADNPEGFVKILQGQDFESKNDWYANPSDPRMLQPGQRPGWPEKFRLMDERMLAPGAHIWNPGQESLEQFTERMRRERKPQQAQNQSAQAMQQSVEELLESMSVEELRKHAQEEMIDLRGAKSRQDILRVLKQHVAVSVA